MEYIDVVYEVLFKPYAFILSGQLAPDKQLSVIILQIKLKF